MDNHTDYRHATRDDAGHYTLGNLQGMLLEPVCNAWSCLLHREHRNTRYRRWHLD
jgi:hypothetical protein